MRHKISKISNNNSLIKTRRQKMLNIVGALLIIMMPAQAISINANGMTDTVVANALRYEHEDAAWSGLMPTVVVSAQRYHTPADMGMMDEVVVAAPRYAHEDVAWTGLMPEVIVTAAKYTIPAALASLWSSKVGSQHESRYSILIIETPDKQIDTFPN
jgi:hypothetical protein